MKVEIKIDENCTESRIVIVTDKITDEISEILQRLSKKTPQILVGVKENTAVILQQSDIVRVYAENGRVYAMTDSEKYQLRLRLYETEEILDKSFFVRTSHSEIVNLKKIKKFDLRFTGTICIIFSNGSTTFASRRYVTKIKNILGI